jgi:hypothetical protein
MTDFWKYASRIKDSALTGVWFGLSTFLVPTRVTRFIAGASISGMNYMNELKDMKQQGILPSMRQNAQGIASILTGGFMTAMRSPWELNVPESMIRTTFSRLAMDLKAGGLSDKEAKLALDGLKYNVDYIAGYDVLTRGINFDTLLERQIEPYFKQRLMENSKNFKNPTDARAVTVGEMKQSIEFVKSKIEEVSTGKLSVKELQKDIDAFIETAHKNQPGPGGIAWYGGKENEIAPREYLAPMSGGKIHQTDLLKNLKEKGVTVVGRNAIIRIDENTVVKDIHGNKITLPVGEEYTPYKLSDNKILLQDGEQVVILKNTYENVKNQNLVLGEKEFGKELNDVNIIVKKDVVPKEIADKEKELKFRKFEIEQEIEKLSKGDDYILVPNIFNLNEGVSTEYPQGRYPGRVSKTAEGRKIHDDLILEITDIRSKLFKIKNRITPVKFAKLTLEEYGLDKGSNYRGKF